ncbi:hypothetical protein WwAna0299, partial [Wolbachia endosymbiont of Drosophila ananassae]
ISVGSISIVNIELLQMQKNVSSRSNRDK